MKSRRKKPQSTAFGRKLLKAMTESVAQLQQARRWPDGWIVRTVIFPDPPAVYAPADFRKIRADLGDIDQAQFSSLVGVSLALVQSWETGRREPSLLARRLLDEIVRDMKRWQAYFKPASPRRRKSTRKKAA